MSELAPHENSSKTVICGYKNVPVELEGRCMHFFTTKSCDSSAMHLHFLPSTPEFVISYNIVFTLWHSIFLTPLSPPLLYAQSFNFTLVTSFQICIASNITYLNHILITSVPNFLTFYTIGSYA